jgi:HPt (histidine-containing phosphotransfer) domain-containing protein
VSDKSEIFDKAAVLDRVGGDEDLLRELLKIAEEHVGASLPKLVDAIDRADTAAVQSVTHNLRSVLGNLGALKAYAALTELERAAQRGHMDDGMAIASSIIQLVEEFFSVSKGS